MSVSTDPGNAKEEVQSAAVEGARPVEQSEHGREGSSAIAESLIACGVEVVFGYTGGAVPALFRSFLDRDIKTIGGRTELAAGWMSYGYNRQKKRAASALLTWVVGALHASPVVYASKLDSTPLLMLTINNPPAMDGRDSLQDAVELYSALKPLAKYSKKITDAGDLPVITRQAIKAASSGRFGPAVLDIAQTAMYQTTTMAVEPLTLPAKPSANEESVARTWELMVKAKRPVLYVGAGVHLAGGETALRELAEMTRIPVVSTSWGGRGALPDRHELYAGPSGSFGWRSANEALQAADLWLAIGTSFSQVSTASWSLKKPDDVVQVDIDDYEVGKIFEPTVGIQADAEAFLSQLMRHAVAAGGAPEGTLADSRESWVQEVGAWKETWLKEMASWYDGTEIPLNQYWVIRTLSEQLPRDALVVGDSGGHAFALYRAFDYQDVNAVPMGGRYMSLGAGLPVAIGAKLASPDRLVVNYHGDGGFYYDLAELATLAHLKIKVVVIVDNNRALLANRASARATGIPNPWSDVPMDTDFVKVAQGFGLEAERVERPEELVPAIQRALAADQSYVIDVHTDPEMRLVRAIRDIVPIVGDRTPKAGHLTTVVEGSWPS